ncbi:MAG: hypothetical protein JXX14_16390 [Deltaproteobacteria bacterium]|nr:hypothetical protein [Deltaproteobacteria bacterium]
MKKLILSVIFTGCVFATVSCDNEADTQCGNSPECADEPVLEAETVSPTAAYRTCTQDEDCVTVETSCSSCCQSDAVNRNLEADYYDSKHALCQDWEGGVCNCVLTEGHSACVLKSCQFVPTESTCDDGWDNDFDGLTDCEDTDCGECGGGV